MIIQKFIYPNQDADGSVDLDPDVVDFSVSFFDFATGRVDLVVGENRVTTQLSLGISFDDLGRPVRELHGTPVRYRRPVPASGRCGTSGRRNTAPTAGVYRFVLRPASGNSIPPPFQTEWAEPDNLLLLLTGLLSIGLLNGWKQIRS